MQIADSCRDDGSEAIVAFYWLFSSITLILAIDEFYGAALRTCSAEVKEITLNLLVALLLIPLIAPFVLAAFDDNRHRAIAVIVMAVAFAVLWNHLGEVVGRC